MEKTFWQKLSFRLRSPAVWASLAALITFMLRTWFHVEIPGWDEFLTLLTAVLVAFGIINNPDHRNSF